MELTLDIRPAEIKMNNESLSNFINQIIYDQYLSTVQLYFSFASLTILVYASLLSLPNEVEHIWKLKFTLPTYLYISTKYPLFVFLPLAIVIDLAPLSLRLCGVVAILAQVLQILSFIGIQGLILIRTYSLSQGYRLMAVALFITFLTALIVQIYGSVSFRLFLVHSVAIILSDTLAFITVFRQVWGLWRLKRSLGLQSNGGFLTLLLQQGTISYCFILSITTVQIFLSLFSSVNTATFASLQVAISALLICKFALDLRRRNTKRSLPNQSALTLPTLTFQENPPQSVRTVLGRLHESIVAEMGERNDPMDMDDSPMIISRGSHDLEDGLQDTNLVSTEDEYEDGDQSEVEC